MYHFQNCLDLTGSSFTYLTNVIFGKQKQGFHNNGSCSMFRLLPHQLFILVQEQCLQALKASKLQPCKVFEHYSLHHHPKPTVKHCVMVCICRKVQTEALPVYRWKLVMQLNHSGRFQGKTHPLINCQFSTQSMMTVLGRTPSHAHGHSNSDGRRPPDKEHNLYG